MRDIATVIIIQNQLLFETLIHWKLVDFFKFFIVYLLMFLYGILLLVLVCFVLSLVSHAFN